MSDISQHSHHDQRSDMMNISSTNDDDIKGMYEVHNGNTTAWCIGIIPGQCGIDDVTLDIVIKETESSHGRVSDCC